MIREFLIHLDVGTRQTFSPRQDMRRKKSRSHVLDDVLDARSRYACAMNAV